jgi:hypothetical protein
MKPSYPVTPIAISTYALPSLATNTSSRLSEQQVGERVLAVLRANTERQRHEGDLLREEVHAVMAQHPHLTAGQVRARLTRAPSLRRVQEIMREIKHAEPSASRIP